MTHPEQEEKCSIGICPFALGSSSVAWGLSHTGWIEAEANHLKNHCTPQPDPRFAQYVSPDPNIPYQKDKAAIKNEEDLRINKAQQAYPGQPDTEEKCCIVEQCERDLKPGMIPYGSSSESGATSAEQSLLQAHLLTQPHEHSY